VLLIGSFVGRSGYRGGYIMRGNKRRYKKPMIISSKVFNNSLACDATDGPPGCHSSIKEGCIGLGTFCYKT